MRISRRNGTGNVGSVGPLGGNTPRVTRPDDAPAPQAGGSDLHISISPRAAEVQQAQAALQSLPDTRVELVAALQGEIDSGRYQRDSHVIAKKMVDEALRESLRQKRGR